MTAKIDKEKDRQNLEGTLLQSEFGREAAVQNYIICLCGG
jgi:hypothetical protein